MLTLYVIPCDNPEDSDIGKLEESVKDVADYIEILDHRRLNEVSPKTKWYMYLFSNEWLDDGLRLALPIFMADEEHDYFVFYKRVFEQSSDTVIPRTFSVPRVFRSEIKLQGEASLIPENAHMLKSTFVLDGWILEPKRKIQ